MRASSGLEFGATWTPKVSGCVSVTQRRLLSPTRTLERHFHSRSEALGLGLASHARVGTGAFASRPAKSSRRLNSFTGTTSTATDNANPRGFERAPRMHERRRSMRWTSRE